MFIGHYGAGFMVRKGFREIPLWVIFICVQLMDIIAFMLVFAGIERAAYRESANPFFRNNLDLPYSHSFSGAVILSVMVYLLCVILRKRQWALIAALCVFSHWIIDFIVHTPDLSLFFGAYKTGLGLWNYPWISFGLEILLVIAGWLILRLLNPFSVILLILLLGSFTGMIFGSEPAVIRESGAARAAMVLGSNILFIIFSYFADRRP